MKQLDKFKNTNESMGIDLSNQSLELWELESNMIRENFYSSIEWNTMLREIEVNDKVKEILEKIVWKCLESKNILYGIDQESLNGKSLEDHFDEISEKHPELRWLLNFDLQLWDIICLNYEDCKPSDKIKLVALMSALDENKVFANSHINEDWSYNSDKIKERYKNEIYWINEDISSIFKLNQYKNFWFVERTLREEYWLSEEEITTFKTYLDEVQAYIDSTKPQEAWMWHAFAFLAWMLVMALWVMVYDKVMNPDWMKEIELNEIELTWLHSLWKLVPAVAEFSQTWEAEEKLYDETTDDWWFKQNAKKIANSLQSKKIIMNLRWKVWAEFDISESSWARFVYDPRDKMMRVFLNEPTFIIRESNPEILYSNDAVFEMSRFNDTEMDLLKDLEQWAVENDSITKPLAHKANQEVAELLYKMYWPLIGHFNHELIWVEVIIEWKSTEYTREELDWNYIIRN